MRFPLIPDSGAFSASDGSGYNSRLQAGDHTETYDQLPINKSTLGDDFRFVKENTNVKVLSYKGSVFAVEPPLFVELEITETDPGFKGNTATNTLKPAIVETGASVQVPLFIEIGDRIKIDTRTGEYLERAKG